MKTLETERLILRAWRSSDLNDFYEYASVEGVGERRDDRIIRISK